MTQNKNTEARSRPQIVREFLSRQGLQAWLAWRPHELCMTIEPGVYVSGYDGGARIEDDVLLTESGHEVLSQDSRGPERVLQT